MLKESELRILKINVGTFQSKINFVIMTMTKDADFVKTTNWKQIIMYLKIYFNFKVNGSNSKNLQRIVKP